MRRRYYLPDKTIKCISVLANAAGMCGMIAGQIRDLDAETRTISAEELTVLQYGKTCMMIIAAAKMGLYCCRCER